MKSSKYNKFLTISLIVVVVIIVGLLIFWGVDTLRKYNVNNSANAGIDAFKNQVGGNASLNISGGNSGGNSSGGNMINPYNNLVIPDDNTGLEGNGGNSGDSEEGMQYKGFTMVGYIEIPKTGIKYPVLKESTIKALETSVAILSGPGLNQIGNTVIVGHNYRNGLFFSDNAKLANGDKVLITDLDGKTVTYTIYKKFQTTPEDGSIATRDTAGAKEITLSTCTDDSKNRIIVYAKAD